MNTTYDLAIALSLKTSLVLLDNGICQKLMRLFELKILGFFLKNLKRIYFFESEIKIRSLQTAYLRIK